MRRQLPLLGEQKTARVAKVNDQQTINLIPTIEDPDAKNIIVLYSSPGLNKITTVGTGPGRANMVRWKGDLYGISGDTLFKMDTSNVVTVITGALNTTSGWCVMAGGRTHLGIVDGTNGYYTDGSTLTQIADADFPNGATHISYLDGRFICADAGTDQFFIADDEDITSWQALNFASAEANPDDILAHTVFNKNLYLAGSDTIQIFYNSGNADFPFDPFPNLINYGIEAKYSLVRDEKGIYFLAIKPEGGIAVVFASGFNSRQISSKTLTWTINNDLTTTDDAIASIHDMKGIPYYVISFPSEDVTYAINTVTGLHHRLKSYNIGRHRALGYGSLKKRQYCMDYDNAKLYELSYTTYDEDTATLERYRRSMVIHENDIKLTYHAVRLSMEAGIGLVTGQGSSPIIQMRYSDDGAKTWSSWLDASIGEIGEYTTIVEWRRLGESRRRIFEFRATDPVPITIIDAYADVEAANE